MGRTFQTSLEEGRELAWSFVPSNSVDVLAGTEIQVWRTDHINQLLRLAHAAARAGNDLHEATVGLDFTFEDVEPELGDHPMVPSKIFDPGPCPRCGRSDMFEVHYVDVGTESGISDLIPGTITCTNPECPSSGGSAIVTEPGETFEISTPTIPEEGP